jgi:mannose-1-phosphate guanylyltransferase / phosphomannomutase
MYSVGKILEMLARTGKTISEIDETIPRRFQYQVDVDCPWQYRGQVMRQAMEYSENIKRELVEGVKVFHEESSVLMMPDHEKGAFLVIAESSKYEDAVSLAKKYGALVTQWQQS